MNFRILPEALQEAIEAAARYDSQQLELGDDFHTELKDAIQRIRANPFAHSRLEEYDGP